MKTVDIYTDGACSGNPGKGGWCAILLFGANRKVLSGGEKETTNNRMEVYAAIAGLSALKEKCAVDLYSDSAYLVNAVEQHWLDNWRRNSFIKVKGHADNEYNNLCDKYARGEIDKL